MRLLTCPCGKPTTGAALCADCAKTLRIALANVAAYHDDLDTVRTRQTRYGTGGGGRWTKGEGPLGMDARFATDGAGTRAQAAARAAVTTWARVLIDDRPGIDRPARDSVRSVCAWLEHHVTTIVGLPWAPELLTDMLAAERALRLVVDRPPDAWYAGPCSAGLGTHDGLTCACACHETGVCDLPGGCGEAGPILCPRMLYATPGDPFVRCRDCGTTWDVAERREWLIREAEDQLAPVEVIVRALTILGDRDVRAASYAARIRKWVERGRIVAHGSRVIRGQIRPTYRIGDVLDMLAQDAERTKETA